MKPLVAAGLAAAGLAALLCIARGSRDRRKRPGRQWIAERMEHMMAGLPEDAPPRLVRSILPHLREQNDQIISLLREQNSLLRERQITAEVSAYGAEHR